MPAPTPLVTVAIPDLDGPAAVATTLGQLARHTPESHRVVVLHEEGAPPGSVTVSAARESMLPGQPPDSSVERLGAPAPFGVPAALNRLLALTSSPYVVVLESGSLVTSGWLRRLLAALDDPTVGLAGPSTNASWNEQQVVPKLTPGGWSVAQVDAFASALAAREGDRGVPLDTLHSLGDFCYLFKREVATAIGGFDTAYGSGPCWEIDFSTRAARAGWGAVWVVGAYVHRAQPSPGRALTVRRQIAGSKRLYQDRFCGLRLRGEKREYEPHCRGEDCEHFAPAELIQIRLARGHDANALGPAVEPSPATDVPPPPPAPQLVPPLAPALNTASQPRVVAVGPDLPLVSCIMPTRDRRRFVGQALRYFERQQYPHRELIVVDDGEDAVADLLEPGDDRTRYIRLSRRTSIGSKRNLACEAARGEVIVHWDDDDWYAPDRLSTQLAPLLAHEADLTGLEAGCFFDPAAWRAWACSDELHRRLFVGDVHGGTLAYRREVWERLAHYPDVSIAEDGLFLRDASRKGARLRKLANNGLFVYVRHDSNAWRLAVGERGGTEQWRPLEPDSWIPLIDRPFYAALRRDVADTPSSTRPALLSPSSPLVSCIMPTGDRRRFVPRAIRSFLRQDYERRELIIVDDGVDRIEDLIPPDPRIRYVGLDRRVVLGDKRNIACEMAHGELVAHWDDDDWYAPQRLREQVMLMERSGADLSGVGRELYYDPAGDRAWEYAYPLTTRPWLAGNSLCYRVAFWEANRFISVSVGEDTRFVWGPAATNVVVAPDHHFMVGILHPGNTGRKTLAGRFWRPVPVNEVHRLLGDDLRVFRDSP